MPAQPITETLSYEMTSIVVEIEAIKEITINEYTECLTLWYYDWITKREHYDMHELHDNLKKNGKIFFTTNNVNIYMGYNSKNHSRPVFFKVTKKDLSQNNKKPRQPKIFKNLRGSNTLRQPESIQGLEQNPEYSVDEQAIPKRVIPKQVRKFKLLQWPNFTKN